MQPTCSKCAIKCGLKNQRPAIWWFTVGRQGEFMCDSCSVRYEKQEEDRMFPKAKRHPKAISSSEWDIGTKQWITKSVLT